MRLLALAAAAMLVTTGPIASPAAADPGWHGHGWHGHRHRVCRTVWYHHRHVRRCSWR